MNRNAPLFGAIGILVILVVSLGITISALFNKTTQLETLNGDLKAREAKISQLEKQVESLSAEKSSLTGVKSILEEKLANAERDLDKAKEKEAGLTRKIADLEEQKKKAEEAVAQTSQSFQEKLRLTTEENKKALELKAQQYQSQEKALLAQIESLKQKYAKFEEEKSALEGKATDLSTQLVQEQSKLDHYKRGLAFENEKNFQAAAEEYEKILQIDPRDANVHLRLASIYVYGIKDPQRADFYTKAYVALTNKEGEVKPKDIASPTPKTVPLKKSVTVEPAQKTAQADKPKHASSEALNRTMETFAEKSVRHHYNLALVYENEGRYEEAAQEYEKTLEFAPFDADIHYNLAILYDDKLGNNQKAIYHYQKYLESAPSAPDADKVEGWIIQAQEDMDWQWKMR